MLKFQEQLPIRWQLGGFTTQSVEVTDKALSSLSSRLDQNLEQYIDRAISNYADLANKLR